MMLGLNDGLNFLRDNNKKYHAIINTSTAQYTVWASKLYSSEFLALAKAHLEEDGVYETWIDASSINDRYNFMAYINFLKKNFAYVDIHVLRTSYIALICYDKFRDIKPFSYDMPAKWAQPFLDINKKWLPKEKSINNATVRNIASDPAFETMEPTFDHPEVEIIAAEKLLSKKDDFYQYQTTYDTISEALNDEERKPEQEVVLFKRGPVCAEKTFIACDNIPLQSKIPGQIRRLTVTGRLPESMNGTMLTPQVIQVSGNVGEVKLPGEYMCADGMWERRDNMICLFTEANQPSQD